MAAGGLHSLGLRANRTVVGWGGNSGGYPNVYGQTIPPAGLTDVVEIGGGYAYSLALRGNGSVVAWGGTTVPADATNIVGMAAGAFHTLLLRANGTIMAWGDNYWGECNIPTEATNIVSIAAGWNQSLALRADGRVFSWGMSQSDPPPDLTNEVELAGGVAQSMALRRGGTVVGWPDTNAIPTNVTDAVAVAMGGPGAGNISVILVRDPATTLPPSMLQQPRSQVVAGGTVVLRGTAYGAQPLRFQWFVNGAPLAGQINNWLALTNVLPEQTGNYQVVALNDFGAVTSSVATVTVLMPPNFLSQPTNLTILAGGNAGFTVTAIGTGQTLYQWQRNGTNLLNDTRIAGADSASLNVSNLISSDAGSYRVVLSNAYGMATSAVATLVVLLPPTISTPPLDQSVPAGTNLTFTVAATGTAPLAYQWRFDQTNLNGATSTSLSLTNVQTLQAGGYDVVVTNAYGAVTSAPATLNVLPSGPRFTLQPASRVASVGQTITFSVAARGTEPLYCQWLSNGTNLPGATAFTLTLPNVNASFTGTYYSALVSNSVNFITTSNALLSVVPVRVWGPSNEMLTAIPASATNLVAVAAGTSHAIALRADGSVVEWSAPQGQLEGSQPPPPPTATNVVALAAGSSHCLALRADGSVIAWGKASTATNVPTSATNVFAIVANSTYSLALRGDGTVVGWGSSRAVLPVPGAVTNVVAIAAGYEEAVALRADGSLVDWGAKSSATPSVTNIVGLSGGGGIQAGAHFLAWLADNTAVSWGANNFGQASVPPAASNVLAVAGGGSFSLALRSDGTVLNWGGCCGVTAVPADLAGATGIAAGSYHGLALVADPVTPPIPPRIGRAPAGAAAKTGDNLVLHALAVSPLPLSYQWLRDGGLLLGQTHSWLSLTNLQPAQAGSYQIVASDAFGSVTSAVAAVSVDIRPPLVKSPTLATNRFTFTFQGALGVLYISEYTDTLAPGSWTEFDSRLGTGAAETVAAPNGPGPARYYRVRASRAP